MSKIVLGVTADGKPFAIDLVLLLETRLLLSANSGGGKSYTLRQLIEQIFGKVQIILVDREGEFKSLRDKYDFLLVGEGGDIPAHIGSARLLAEKLLESGVSAICDLYEAFRTRPIDRLAWVREFLMGLVDAPKHLWHDVIVIVDEAHLFCPEVAPKGRNMEERETINGCKDAVVALCTVGRKRGQTAVLATQRLAKLDKDASAELLNRMIGMTLEGQDVDRAIDLMSIPKDEKAEFRKSLRELEPGNLYAFGRAISKERILVKINQVQTKHHDPRSRKHVDYSPPTPAKIQALLSKFEGLPKEIEAKAKTEKELRAENAALKQKLAAALKAAPEVAKPVALKVSAPVTKTVEKRVEVPVLKESELKRLEKIAEKVSLGYESASKAAGAINHALVGIRSELGKPKHFGKFQDARIREAHDAFKIPGRVKTEAPPRKPPPKMEHGGQPPPEGEALLAGERKMLGVLAQFHPGSRTKSQLGALSGYTPSGGTFGQYYGKLKRQKLIKEGNSGEVSISEAGLEWFGGEIPEGPKSAEELLAMWRGKLLQGERKMLDTLVQVYPSTLTKEELGEKSGYASSGGTFGQYLGTLRRNALVLIDGDDVRAAETLFDLSPGVA